ncbi:hypothetical protein ONS96_010995 [Cadophora gregata f. sp. sojae]|nr:hypothetical protein ONS96_010995 [Cadophora gregata f. sp. sojae]
MNLSNIYDSWTGEISMTFCIVCCGALATVLVCWDGHTAPQVIPSFPQHARIYPRFSSEGVSTHSCGRCNRSLNLQDNKLGNAASAIELFDDASRGSMGAITRLLSGRRGPIVAGICTLVIITSVAFGAFIQQAISYPLQLISKPCNKAQMPIIREFHELVTSSLASLS